MYLIVKCSNKLSCLYVTEKRITKYFIFNKLTFIECYC